MNREERTRARREPTRRVILASVLLFAAILGGAELLLRAKPLADTADLAVDGVPAVGADAADPRTCRRDADDSVAQEIREQAARGGVRITSSQVYGCPSAFDGLRIIYAGEVIGEVLQRDGGAWTQVNDDAYALDVGPLGRHAELRGFNTGLSVWLPDGLHEAISGVGRPGQRGDVVLLEGVVDRADREDGGSLTLRADSLRVLAPAVELDEPFHRLQALVAGLLAVSAVGAVLWSRRERRR